MSFFAPLLLNRQANPSMWAIDYVLGGTYKISQSGIITPSGPGFGSSNSTAYVFDGTYIWVASAAWNYISKVSATGIVTSYWTGINTVGGMAFDGTDIWFTDSTDTVYKISTSGNILDTYPVGVGPRGIAFDGTNMWTANFSGNSVSRITPAGVVTNVSSGTFSGPRGIAFDGTDIWITNFSGNSVSRIHPADLSVVTYSGTGGNPYGIAFNPLNRLMYIVNSSTNNISTIPADGGPMNPGVSLFTGEEPTGIAFDGTNMWTSNSNDGSVTKIPPLGAYTTYTGVGTAPGGPAGIVYDGALLSHWWGGS